MHDHQIHDESESQRTVLNVLYHQCFCPVLDYLQIQTCVPLLSGPRIGQYRLISEVERKLEYFLKVIAESLFIFVGQQRTRWPSFMSGK